MKKFLIAAAMLMMALTASAQKFGVTGGLTLSHLDDIGNSANTGYHAGLAFNAPLGLGFSLQPELLYNVKGATLLEDANVKYTAGYCELGLQAQWGIDLIVARPFVLVEPFIGGGLHNSLKQDSFKDSTWDFAKRLECGFALGGGLEVLYNFQIAVKYFWTVGSLFDGDGKLNPGIGETVSGQVSDIMNGNCNFAGTTVSLTYFF